MRMRRWDRSRYLVFSSPRLHEVDMTSFMILSSHHLVLMKLKWRYPAVSRLVVFLSSWGWLDMIQYLVFSSFLPHEVDLTRSRILSSCLFFKSSRLDYISSMSSILYSCLIVLMKSTWRDPVSRLSFLMQSTWRDPWSCLLVFSS